MNRLYANVSMLKNIVLVLVALTLMLAGKENWLAPAIILNLVLIMISNLGLLIGQLHGNCRACCTDGKAQHHAQNSMSHLQGDLMTLKNLVLMLFAVSALEHDAPLMATIGCYTFGTLVMAFNYVKGVQLYRAYRSISCAVNTGGNRLQRSEPKHHTAKLPKNTTEGAHAVDETSTPAAQATPHEAR